VALTVAALVGGAVRPGRKVGAGAWGTTRKHVCNDAGTRPPESV